MISLSLGSSGGNPAFQVSYDAAKGIATIKYGIMNVNSQFVASDPIVGTATQIFAPPSNYVYVRIDNMFNRKLQPFLSFFSAAESPDGGISPDGIQTKKFTIDGAPFPNTICLGFINKDGKVFDLRPTWIINVFSFLG